MARFMDSYLDHAGILEAGSPKGVLRRLAERTFRVVRDYRARRALHGLSDSMLEDIGLRRGDLGQISPEAWWQPTDWRSLDALRHGRSR